MNHSISICFHPAGGKPYLTSEKALNTFTPINYCRFAVYVCACCISDGMCEMTK